MDGWCASKEAARVVVHSKSATNEEGAGWSCRVVIVQEDGVGNDRKQRQRGSE